MDDRLLRPGRTQRESQDYAPVPVRIEVDLFEADDPTGLELLRPLCAHMEGLQRRCGTHGAEPLSAVRDVQYQQTKADDSRQ